MNKDQFTQALRQHRGSGWRITSNGQIRKLALASRGSGHPTATTFCPITALIFALDGSVVSEGAAAFDGPRRLGISKELAGTIIEAADKRDPSRPDARRLRADLISALGLAA